MKRILPVLMTAMLLLSVLSDSSCAQMQNNAAQPASSAVNSAVSNEYGALSFIDSKTGWVVNGNKLLETTDGGNTWTTAAGVPAGIAKLDFVDEQNGWAITKMTDSDDKFQYGILHTADGGVNWKAQLDTSAAQGSWISGIAFDLKCMNANNGFAIIGGRLYQTSNGSTWSDVTPSQNFSAEQLHFINASEGWAGGNQDGAAVLYKTDDGGTTWAPEWKVSGDDYAGDVVALDFINASDGWILVDGPDVTSGRLFQTADGGKTFQNIMTFDSIARPMVEEMVFTDGNTGWIATNHGAGPINGGVMGTTDGGRTFAYVVGGDSGAYGSIDAVDNIVFPSSEIGFATGSRMAASGEAGCLFGTSDGGKTWKQISPCAPTDGISFVDDKNGFGIGTAFAENAVLSTSDGGAKWRVLPSVPDAANAPVGISFINPKTGFALCPFDTPDASDGVTLYKTADGGSTWAKTANVGGALPEWGAPDYFRMFDVRSGVTAWQSAGGLYFYATVDGGATWRSAGQYSPPGDYVMCCAFSSADKGVIFLSDGKNLSIATYDNGKICQSVAVSTAASEYVSWNVAAGAGNRIAALYSTTDSATGKTANVFELSGDGGATWQSIPASPDLNSVLPDYGYSLSFINEDNGFMLVSGFSSLLVTTDGGNTWSWK